MGRLSTSGSLLPIAIRPERSGDEAAVEHIVRLAFEGDNEARLVARLRTDGDAALSLVAVHGDGDLVGHILFSRLGAPFPALALAPLSVTPGAQRRGIGSALVHAGLERARAERWQAAFVLGDTSYYGRFGFALEPARSFSCPYSGSHFMMLALGEALPAATATLAYPAAFASL